MTKIEDFILEYDNFFSKDECKKYIEFYEHAYDCGLVQPRQEQRHDKDDYAMTFQEIIGHEYSYSMLDNAGFISKIFIKKFWEEAYAMYSKKFSVLNNMSPHQIFALKLQKTEPGQAYHIWHEECSSNIVFNRFLTFILYLNDVEEGGETEFLYYPKRIKPKEGKLILFPGTFTHTHRGNQPLSGEKYIVTGWVFFNG